MNLGSIFSQKPYIGEQSRRRSPEKGYSSKREGQHDSRERSSSQGKRGDHKRSPVRGDGGRSGASRDREGTQSRAGPGKSMVGHGGMKSEISHDRPNLDDRNRLRLDDRDRHRPENRDRSLLSDRDTHMREGHGQDKVDDGDHPRLKEGERKKPNDHDRPSFEDGDDRTRIDGSDRKASNHDPQILGDGDRSKLEDGDRTKLGDRDRAKLENDRYRLVAGDRQRLDERERQKRDDRDRSTIENHDGPKLEDRDRQRLNDRDRPRLDDRDRSRPVDHGRSRFDDRDRLRSVDRDRQRLADLERQRLEGLDRQRHDSRARLRLDDRDRPRMDDRERLRIDDRDRSRLNNRDRLRLDDRDRPRMEDVERQRLMDIDRQRPMDVDRHRLFEFDRQRLLDVERQRLVDRDRQRLIDRERQWLDERGRNRHESEEWPGRPQEWLGHSADRRRMDVARHDRGMDRRNRGDSRDRHDSRDEDPSADADVLGEEEPEEGELVIEPSAPPPTVTRPPSTFKKTRWGNASTMEVPDGGVAKRSSRSASGRVEESLGDEGGKAPEEGEAVDKSIGEDMEEGAVEPAATQGKGGDRFSGREEEKNVVGGSPSGDVPTRSLRDEGDGSRNGLKLDGVSSKGDADEGSLNQQGDKGGSAPLALRRTDVEPPSSRAESRKQENVSISSVAPEVTEAGGGMREQRSAVEGVQEAVTKAMDEDGEVGDVRMIDREIGAVSSECFSSVVADSDPGVNEPESPRVEGRSGKGDTEATSGAASREKGPVKQSEIGGAVEPSKWRATGDPGNLACFLRKNSSGTPAGVAHRTATVALDSAATVDDGAPSHQSASHSSTSQRGNASPRAGGPEAKASAAGKESITAVSDAAGPRASSRAPMGLAATWGSGRSADAMPGWGGSKEDGTSDAAGTKREGGGKDEASARTGGAASRLMNAALQSSRDGGRREKKGADGGRSRVWRTSGDGGVGGGYGSE